MQREYRIPNPTFRTKQLRAAAERPSKLRAGTSGLAKRAQKGRASAPAKPNTPATSQKNPGRATATAASATAATATAAAAAAAAAATAAAVSNVFSDLNEPGSSAAAVSDAAAAGAASDAVSGEHASVSPAATRKRKMAAGHPPPRGGKIRRRGARAGTADATEAEEAGAAVDAEAKDTAGNLESDQWEVDAILDYDEESGDYLVLWDCNPAQSSWVPASELSSCILMIVTFHCNEWREVDPELRQFARTMTMPGDETTIISDTEGNTTPDEATLTRNENQRLLDVWVGVRKVATSVDLANAQTLAEAQRLVQESMQSLIGYAQNTITSAAYFAQLAQLVDTSVPLGSFEVAEYFRRVLHPIGREKGIYVGHPALFDMLSQGRSPMWRREPVPRTPGSTLLLPCIHPGHVRGTVGHWTLLIIVWPKTGAARTYVFDSIGNKPMTTHKQALRQYRQLCVLFGEGATISKAAADRPTALNTRNAQGPSGVDCGVWMMAYARALVLGERYPLPALRQIPFLRALLVAEIFAGDVVPRMLNAVPATDERCPIPGIPFCLRAEVRFCDMLRPAVCKEVDVV